MLWHTVSCYRLYHLQLFLYPATYSTRVIFLAVIRLLETHKCSRPHSCTSFLLYVTGGRLQFTLSLKYFFFFFRRRIRSPREEQRFAILTTEKWILKVFFFLFTHLEGGRMDQDCSYWHRISRNGGLAAAIVVAKESRVLLWKWKKEENFRFLFSITHRSVLVVPEMAGAKSF